MNFKRFKLCITNVTEGNVVCTDPVIQWFFGEDVVKSCEYADGCLEITILEDDIEGLKGKCISGTIACDNCEKCPPQDFEICFCETNDDCDDCEVCVNGVCQSACEDGQVCVDDACQDCSTDSDCPNNKVCIGGKCLCPPNQPYEDEFGNCYGCKTDAECDPCERCIDGNCTPLNCGDNFICDPNQDTCVECYNSGHCQNRDDNKSCCGTDNECECCPGYVFDTNLGVCIEEPECSLDDECETCETCIDGECIPIECPENYACDPLTGDCVWNPCPDQPCTNGAECGEDCGCAGGMCVPCKDRSCSDNECEEALGCDCVNSICKSADDGCVQTPCANSFDCGEGCTCYEGTCVSCDNFSCLTSDCAIQVGCKCEGTECVGEDVDDCGDNFTLEKVDVSCDLIATLGTSNACSCPQITVRDIYEGLKLDVQVTPSLEVEVYLDFLTELRKGNELGNIVSDITKENIADNETPTSGTITHEVILDVRDLTTGNVTSVSKGTFITDLAGEGSVDSKLILGTITAALNGQNPFDVIFSIDPLTSETVGLTVNTTISNLIFPNGCNYNQTSVGSVYFALDGNPDVPVDLQDPTTYSDDFVTKNPTAYFKTLSSDNRRNPMFVWYKSEDTTFGPEDVFRKIYLSEDAANTYIDTLYGPEAIDPKGQEELSSPQGELWANRYYQVTNDCSCENIASLGEKLFFCNPDEFDYSLTECGTVITLDTDFVPCDVNADLTNIVGIDIPSDVQVEYDIYINNVKTPDSPHRGTISAGWTYTNPNSQSITSIKVVQTLDDEEICAIDLTDDSVVVPDPIPTIACSAGTFSATFNASYSGSNVTDIFLNGANIGGLIASNLERNVDHVFTINFDTDCIVTKTINEDCCSTFTTGVNTVVDECAEGADATVTPLPNNGKPSYDIVITSGSEVGYSYQGSGLNPITISNFVAGNYTLTVTDSAGCVASVDFTLSRQEQLELIVTPDSGSACENQTVQVNFSTNQSNGTLVYSVDNASPIAAPLDANGSGNASFNIGSSDSTLDVLSVSGSTCTFTGLTGQYDETITVISEPNAVLSGVPANACTGQSFTAVFTGDVGAVVDLSGTTSLNLPASVTIGGSGTENLNITPTASGGATINIDSITIGDCVNNSGSTTNFNVITTPVINNWLATCSTSTIGDVDISLNAVSGATVEIISPITASFTEPMSGSYTYTYVSGAGVGVQVRITEPTSNCDNTYSFTLPTCTCDSLNVDVTADGGSPTTEIYGCVGSTVDLLAAATGGTGGPYSYTWTIGTNTYTGASQTNFPISIQGIVAGSVLAIDQNNNSCQGTQNFNLNGVEVPSASINISQNPGCVGGTYVFTSSVTPSGGSVIYTWGTDDGSAVITNPVPGTANIVFSGDNGGSPWTITLDIDRTENGVTCSSSQATTQISIAEPVEYDVSGDYAAINSGCGPCASSYGIEGTYFIDPGHSVPFEYDDTVGCLSGGNCGNDTDGQMLYGLAQQILTLTGQPLDTQTVVINSTTYTFQTVLTDVDGNVAIGATAPDSVANLIAAINLDSGAGTAYAASMTVNPDVTAAVGTTTLKMEVTAKLLTDNWVPNGYGTTETLTSGSWAAATLSGGWGGADQVPWDNTNAFSGDGTRLGQTGIRTTNGDDEIVMTWTHAGGAATSIGFAVDNIGEMWVDGTKVFDITDVNGTLPAVGLADRPFKNWWVIEHAVSNGNCIFVRASSFSNQFTVGFEFYDQDISTLKGDTSATAITKAAVDGYVIYDSQDVIAAPVTYGLTGYYCDNGTPETAVDGTCAQPECTCS